MTTSENIITLHDERFLWDEHSAFIVFTVFTILTVISFIPCICFGGAEALREKGGKWTSRPAIAGMMFWFISFTLMAVYCRQLDINIQHEYYGLVRLTGYSSREYTESQECGSIESPSTCYQRFAAVDLEVDWGYGWACPSAPQTQCHEPIEGACAFKICEAKRCSDRETDRAFEKAIACAEKYYNSTVEYAAYDPESGPSQDENWPSVLAYGDCESCSARLSIPSAAKLRKLKISGATLFFAGVCSFLSAVACLVLGRQARPTVAREGNTHNAAEDVDVEVCVDEHVEKSSKDTDSTASPR